MIYTGNRCLNQPMLQVPVSRTASKRIDAVISDDSSRRSTKALLLASRRLETITLSLGGVSTIITEEGSETLFDSEQCTVVGSFA